MASAAYAAGNTPAPEKTIPRAVAATAKNHANYFHAEIIESQSACGFADHLVDNTHDGLSIKCVARNLRNDNRVPTLITKSKCGADKFLRASSIKGTT